MKINPSIFKSRDIRGIYPKDLNEEVGYKIGQAFVEHVKAKEVVVAQDMRLSSPALFEALVKGITAQGADVYNIGQVPTECLYFTVGQYGYDSGIKITARHNPKEYNGFKLIKRIAEGLDLVRGKDMIQIIEKGDFPKIKKKGEVKEKNIWQDYLNHIFSFIDVNKINPFKVIIDAGNGMAGKVIPLIEEKLPIKIIPLNFKLDGTK